MPKKLRPALILLAICGLVLLADRLAAVALDHLTLSSRFRYSELYRGGMAKDVVVIGNSRSIHSFYAPEFASGSCVKAYHLGYNGLTTDVASAVWSDYLVHNQPPKVLFVELSMLYSDSAMALQMRPYASHSSGLPTVIGEHEKGWVKWSDVSHLYRFNSELFLRALFYLRRGDQTWINRGETISPAIIAAGNAGDIDHRTFGARESADLKALVQAAHRKGVVVVGYIAPYHPSVFLNAERRAKLVAFRRAAAAAAPLDAMVDLADMRLPDRAYSDLIHLNLEGARPVDKVLEAKALEVAGCGPGAAAQPR